MKIYTKTGDDGTTGLFAGPRVLKDDVRIAAYGTVDELNAWLGWLLAHLPEDLPQAEGQPDLRRTLSQIQSDLFAAGAQLATPAPEEHGMCILHEQDIQRLEAWIDRAEGCLPKLKSFIMPGGTPSAAALHVARTVCRRAEREVVRLGHNLDDAGEIGIIVRYLNRLSDLLFVAARLANHWAGVEDVPWEGKPATGRRDA